MRIVNVKDSETLRMLENESALTIEGVIEEDAQKFVNWVKNHTSLSDEVVYIIKGKVMNQYYGLTGNNAYQDDFTIQAIPLDLMEDVGAIVFSRFEIGGRWFDDVVDNNARREMMNYD